MKFGSVVYEIGLYAIGQTKRQTNKQTDGQTDTCADPRGEPGDSLFWKGKRFFTARRYASAVYAVVERRSVCLSVTSWHCTKTTKHIGSLKQRRTIAQGVYIVFWSQKSRRSSNGDTHYGGAK